MEAKDPMIVHRNKLAAENLALSRAINASIRFHANLWGIRFDQAQALLLDRKAVA